MVHLLSETLMSFAVMLASKLSSSHTVGINSSARLIRIGQEFKQSAESWLVRKFADRYERRWMEKQNKNVRDKHQKKERARIIKLVEMAYKYDPRVKQ